MLSRSKPVASNFDREPSTKNAPKMEEYLEKRDFSGALTLLEFNGDTGGLGDADSWIAYCAFHLGDYARAATIYEARVKKQSESTDRDRVNLASCYFYLGMLAEARRVLDDGDAATDSVAEARSLRYLLREMGNERETDPAGCPSSSEEDDDDAPTDQMCRAFVHYRRARYREAIDIYKKMLLKNRDYLALNVYLALCYYKLDYYDVAQEALRVYLQKFPDSVIAINLKACNHFRLYDGNAARTEMKRLLDKTATCYGFGHDLVHHNAVVFGGGEGAPKVLPSLADVVPEARLNLVIHHLERNNVYEAYELMKNVETAALSQEYILKAIVDAAMGEETGSKERIKTAREYFQRVGSSTSECDTIPGRQCMASCYFLCRRFDRVLLYLRSIKTYFSNDDRFNFNYAQAQAAVGYFKEAEEALLAIGDERYKNDRVYEATLAYCYIMNEKAQLAWELYLKMETSTESFALLQLIANACYKIGEFWYAAKAFDMLERLDSTPENWEGKRGACCGTFRYIVAGKQPKELLKEMIELLRNTSNSQVDQIIRVMRKWGKENRVVC